MSDDLRCVLIVLLMGTVAVLGTIEVLAGF